MAPPRRRALATFALAAFFVSGFAGLVYEVCWIRRASLVFGSTTQALSTVLAVFFLGIAAGSVWFGERSRRIRRPLRVCGLLELGVAACALLSLPAFDAIAVPRRWRAGASPRRCCRPIPSRTI
jgi:spermidine synthase